MDKLCHLSARENRTTLNQTWREKSANNAARGCVCLQINKCGKSRWVKNEIQQNTSIKYRRAILWETTK